MLVWSNWPPGFKVHLESNRRFAPRTVCPVVVIAPRAGGLGSDPGFLVAGVWQLACHHSPAHWAPTRDVPANVCSEHFHSSEAGGWHLAAQTRGWRQRTTAAERGSLCGLWCDSSQLLPPKQLLPAVAWGHFTWLCYELPVPGLSLTQHVRAQS